MFDRELTEFVTVKYDSNVGDVRVNVYKVGGGTVGRKYEGKWQVLLESLDEVHVYADSEITTGTPHTHEYVADLARDLMPE